MNFTNQIKRAYSTVLKRSHVVLFLLIVSPGGVFSQNNEDMNPQKIRFGPKLGMTFSNAQNTQEDTFESTGKLGFVGGGFITIPLGSVISFQPEVLFTQKGFYGTSTMMGTNYEFRRTSNFLDIPVFAVWNLSPHIKVLAGPQFSFLLNQKDEVTYPVNSATIENVLATDNIRNSIVGGTVGLDFCFQKFVVGLRGSLDFQENRTGNSITTPRYKNGWFQVTVGVAI